MRLIHLPILAIIGLCLAAPPEKHPKGAKGPNALQGEHEKEREVFSSSAKPETDEEKFKKARKEKRTKQEEQLNNEKKKPVDAKKDAFKADTDGTFDEWLNKSRAIESGAKKLYEEAEKKVNALSQESKKPFETQLKDIKKRVDSISADVANLEKEADKSKSESIQKAFGHFLAHYRLRAMVKADVTELALDIARGSENGDEVIKALKDFLVTFERSALI